MAAQGRGTPNDGAILGTLLHTGDNLSNFEVVNALAGIDRTLQPVRKFPATIPSPTVGVPVLNGAPNNALLEAARSYQVIERDAVAGHLSTNRQDRLVAIIGFRPLTYKQSIEFQYPGCRALP